MKKKLLLALILTTLVISGCGSKEPSTNLSVDMTDFAFTPNQYKVPAGQQITLQVTHDGLVTHEFIIMKYGTEVGEHFSEEDRPNIYWQIDVQPGESNSFTFQAPDQPGIYQVVCGMAGHVEAGMVGKLEVTSQ